MHFKFELKKRVFFLNASYLVVNINILKEYRNYEECPKIHSSNYIFVIIK